MTGLCSGRFRQRRSGLLIGQGKTNYTAPIRWPRGAQDLGALSGDLPSGHFQTFSRVIEELGLSGEPANR